MRETTTTRDTETLRHNEIVSHNPTQRYRKRTQRSQALGSEYFDNLTDFDSMIATLEFRGDKSRVEWKKDKRLAHSIKSRQEQARLARLNKLGTTDGLQLAKNSKLNNTKFVVCQLKNSGLSYSPIYRNIGGTPENEFNEQYKKERYVLDKQQSNRSKN